MLLILTGDGKGKTTSALGTALRSAGWGKKTAIIFFDKGGKHYGEDHVLPNIPSLEVYRFGLSRINDDGSFRFDIEEADLEEAGKGLAKFKELLENDYDLIVCDEIINCINLEMLKESDVLELLNKKSEQLTTIFTGRNASAQLLKRADLVTECKKIKHYFDKGVKAQKGVEF